MALGSNMKRPNKPKGLVTQIKKSRKAAAAPKKKEAKPVAQKNSKAKAPKKTTSKVVAKSKAKASAKPKTTVQTKAKERVATKPAAKAKAQAKPKTKKSASVQVAAKKIVKAPPVKEAKAAPIPESNQANKVEKKTAFKNALLIIEPSKRRKIRKTKVWLEGELSINNVDSFIVTITPIFQDYDYVDFSLRNVTMLDLSYIQMLYSFQKKFEKKGKHVTIDADLPTEVKKLVVRAGFEELMFIPKLV